MIQRLCSGYASPRTESRDSNKCLRIRVHGSVIHNGRKAKATQASLGRTRKHVVPQPYHVVQLSLWKEGISDTCHCADEPRDSTRSEARHPRKNEACTTPLARGTRSGPTRGDRKNGGHQGLGAEWGAGVSRVRSSGFAR